MKGTLRVLAAAGAALAVVLSGVALSQGGTSSTLSGVVLDSGGGVVPGADVVAKNDATGVEQASVTNAQGAFSFPGLNVGGYTVTVSLQGFKTFVAKNVVLTTGAPASVKAVLEIGGMTEQVTVSSSSEIIQTQSSTVSTTINSNQITKLPLTSRSAMDFVNLLAGVSTPGGNRDATINGLPQGTINITLDGVNIQDNTLKTGDGCDVAERVQHTGSADRAVLRAGKRARLHRAGQRRQLWGVRCPLAGVDRPAVPAGRLAHLEADHHCRPHELRVGHRAAERVQPPEFRSRRRSRQQHRELRGHRASQGRTRAAPSSWSAASTGRRTGMALARTARPSRPS